MSDGKELFDKRRYSYNEISAIADVNNLEITDCEEDDYPHITVAEPDGDPLWQFNYVEQRGDSDGILALTWTDWDEEPTPETLKASNPDPLTVRPKFL